MINLSELFNIDRLVLKSLYDVFPIPFLGGLGYYIRYILLLYIISQLTIGYVNIKKVKENNNIYGKRRDSIKWLLNLLLLVL